MKIKRQRTFLNDFLPSQFANEQEDIATEVETKHDEPNADCTKEQTETKGRYLKVTRKLPERLGDYYEDNDNKSFD